MKDQAFAGFKAIGHQGWTAMPKFGWGLPAGAAAGSASPYDLWWIVMSTIVMGVGIGVLAQPQLVVRFLTVKSGRELNRALVYRRVVHSADDGRGLHRRRRQQCLFFQVGKDRRADHQR